MWKCHKCGKPVYFAERRQSLGFDWHPWCLKCEECGKVLNPGQHAEHKGRPFCHIPCYSALFGPRLFGHGSTVESHQSFGQRSKSFIREQKTLERQIRDYNTFYEEKEGHRMGISYREVNGRLVFEGVLRVFWGVESSIRLREYDDKRLIAQVTASLPDRQRKCISMGYQLEKRLLHPNDEESSQSEEESDHQMQSLPATSNTKKTTARSRDCPSDQLVKFKLGAIGKEDSASGPSSANQCNADDDGKQNSCPKDVMTKSVSEVEEDSSRLHNHSHDNPERACVASRRGSSYGYQAFASKIQPRQRRHKSLPDRIDERETKRHEWDEIDDLLIVERSRHDVYHTIHQHPLPRASKGSPLMPGGLDRVTPSENIPGDVNTGKTTLEKLFLQAKKAAAPPTTTAAGPNGDDQIRSRPEKDFRSLPTSVREDKIIRGRGPRALRRRHGKKMDRSRVIRRRSSINGHWYDRDTSVFTPPKGSSMAVHVTSLLPTPEVVRMILDKYQVESEASEFALYVLKESGERRLISDQEFPLRLRVRLGPHESIAKLYLLDKRNTTEVKHEVAQYLKFSYAECRAILNMFYEEEEKEVAYIHYKYKRIKHMLKERMFDLKVRF